MGDTDKNAKTLKAEIFDGFVEYVANRNISIMTKAEWEQLYFYYTAKFMFEDKSLVSLSTAELYEIGNNLHIDFSKVSSLIKKCYRFEYDSVKNMNFHQLFNNNAILDLNIENDYVKFGVTNSLVQERIEEILSTEGIFSDSSFKKTIFQVPVYGMLKILDNEIPSGKLLEKLKSMKETILSDLKGFFNYADTEEKDLAKELENMINRKDLKSVSSFLIAVAKIINQPLKSLFELVLPKLVDNNPKKIILEELVSTQKSTNV